jgi:alpha-tubulin suppressor-like RCC1 family protein
MNHALSMRRTACEGGWVSSSAGTATSCGNSRAAASRMRLGWLSRAACCVLGASSGIMRGARRAALAVGVLLVAPWALPTEALSLTGMTTIEAGGFYTCALTGGGGIKCWGSNGNGQLGDGTTVQRLKPVDVSGLASGVTAIDAAYWHTCALNESGAVKCWGTNYVGQLGDGTITDRLTPVDVSGLASGVTAIAAGAFHSCALTSGGGVKCWGDNRYGQLGDGTTTNRLTPVDVSGLASGVTAIAAGYWHTCALTIAGGVKCWGANPAGQLGDGTSLNTRLTPVDVTGLASGVTAIAAGYEHTCALTSGGGVKCWGSNGDGRLGDGTLTNRLTPVDVTGLGGGVTAIKAGAEHSCALTDVGGVKCWGYNVSGQLGDGTTMDRSTPVDVSGLGSSVTAIAAGHAHSCALTSGGRAKCWGYNWYGQLGDGTISMGRLTPGNVLIAPVVRDFNGGGKGDILWRNSSTGATALWLMNGLSPLSSAFLLSKPSWAVTHVGDFNGDWKADLVWRNSVTGETAIRLMDGTTSIGSAIVFSNGSWAVTAVGDFNGDGKADLVWRNSTTGQTAIWLMDGLVASASAVIFSDANWVVTHVADVSGDGKADLLWRNSETGQTAAWLMDGLVPLYGGVILPTDANWSITHTGDFNHDGKADLVWRNSMTGQTAIWLMDGLAPSAGGVVFADGNWSVVLTGDTNGDGRTDLVWESATGQTAIWLMDALAATASAVVFGDPNWMVTHSADLDGDDKVDLIWRNLDTGETVAWLMDGLSVSSFGGLFGDPNWAVHPVEGH